MGRDRHRLSPTIIPTDIIRQVETRAIAGGGGSGASIAAGTLAGRGLASGAGVYEQITLGTNLSMAGTTLNAAGGGGGAGTVTSVSVTTAAGVSGSVATATTTPAITITLGAISPTSVAASGAVTGSNLSGTNTGDQTSVTGNAGTATALLTARNINGVAFDGTGNITINAVDSTARLAASAVSAFGLTLIDDVDAAAARTTLGAQAAGSYLTGNQTITLSGDASGSGATAITVTLATVNANTGTFGGAATVPQFSVNGKGLITGVTAVGIAAPWGALTGVPAPVTALLGTNTGDQTTIVGITGTKAQFDTAVTDGNILYVGDVTQYTDEMAQDAVGAMVDGSLTYVDATPLLQRAALMGAVTAPAGSNATSLGSFTSAQLNAAISDGDFQPLDTQLTDLAGLAYAGNTLKVVRVNAAENGWELATAASGPPALTTVEKDLGTAPVTSGKFTITGAGMTIGKPVFIQQAVGPYTGKGTLADEAEMDQIVVTGSVTSATVITCYWTNPTSVRGNIKFDYLVGA